MQTSSLSAAEPPFLRPDQTPPKPTPNPTATPRYFERADVGQLSYWNATCSNTGIRIPAVFQYKLESSGGDLAAKLNTQANLAQVKGEGTGGNRPPTAPRL